MTQLAKIRSEARRWGVAGALYAALLRALGRFLRLRLHTVIERPLRPDVEPSALDPGPGREIRVLSADDCARGTDDPALHQTPAFFEAAIARGDRGLGVFEGDRLLAYGWKSTSPTPHVGGVWAEFSPRHRYGYKSFTRPEARGEHLAHYIALWDDDWYLARGLSHTIGFYETHNYASRLLNLRNGNRAVGYAVIWRLPGWTLCLRSPGARRVGFRFFVPGRREASRTADGSSRSSP